jgi:hypoxanthine phosphoribosyltransferase
MNDERLEPLLDGERIAERVAELGAEISRDYDGKNLLLLCVLKGAVVFLADLVRSMSISAEIDFVAASSYEGDASKGEVSFSPVFRADITGKDVLIIEDIYDTGLTCSVLIRRLSVREPASLRLCALLDKPAARKAGRIAPDYVGFEIPDRFVVGYGLDYREKYRGLKDICILAT